MTGGFEHRCDTFFQDRIENGMGYRLCTLRPDAAVSLGIAGRKRLLASSRYLQVHTQPAHLCAGLEDCILNYYCSVGFN